MKKLVSLLAILILTISLLGTYRSASADNSAWIVLSSKLDQKINQAVQNKLQNLQPGEMTTVIITLREQADLTKVRGASRAARQQSVIRALQAVANASQNSLKNLLDTRQTQGSVSSYSSFWVFNGISVTANSTVVNELAQQPDVYSITDDALSIVPAYAQPETNIALINAPALWASGNFGQGVVVANLDSGVDVNHPELSTRWRGGSNSWYDPYGQHSTPTDLTGHGTQTMGIMVAGDASGSSIGVAPGAQWIAAKIFNDAGGSTATAIHQSFQWLLDPDGNPNTADAPDVVNNSWSFANPGCDQTFEPDLESLRAAGILPIFAAGNGGPSNNTSYSPANNLAAFAVGAINNNSSIYAYSSRGPTTCGGSTGPFPEVVAPGVLIKTADLYGLYTNAYSGTSYAAPQVAGGLALLLAAYPDLDAGMQEQALIQSAVDLGTFGPDDTYGYGSLDLAAALTWASTAPTSTPVPTITFTPSPTATFTATAVPNVNLALNQPVITSSSQDSAHTGNMAVDGSLATEWQTQKVKGRNGSSNEWLEVDLGTSQNVSQIVVEWDTYYATSYNIQVSNNYISWTTVFSTSNGNGGNDTVSFNTVQTRYVRFNSTAWNNSSYRVWLKEFEVYPAASTSTATETATPTTTPSPTPTISSGSNVHVGDLAASSTSNGSRWNANVVILVHDSAEQPVSGVTVSGAWSNGATGSGSCTTNSSGICIISRNNLKNSVGSVTFSVTGLSASASYDPSANHDPDIDSNGAIITVTKP